MLDVMAKDRYWKGDSLDKLFWYHLKRLKEHISSDRKPEVDHIVPVSKGGATLGLDNHQAICYTCHKVKTKVDNSGPRKKS
jgi:5-methylcytosine-specific restriction endonuclease McrA